MPTELVIIALLALILSTALITLFLVMRAHRRRLEALNGFSALAKGKLVDVDQLEREIFGKPSSSDTPERKT